MRRLPFRSQTITDATAYSAVRLPTQSTDTTHLFEKPAAWSQKLVFVQSALCMFRLHSTF